MNYEKINGRQCEIEADSEDILQYVQKEMLNPKKYKDVRRPEIIRECTACKARGGCMTDFFHYVMFSWGNCQAGDRLVMERMLGRSPSPDEMGAGFTPGVRFYFKYDDLEKHPLAVHDGFLPVKVKDEVKLADYVHMIVIPSEYRKQIMEVMPEKLSDRAFCLSHDKLDVWQWSEKVYSFVHDIAKSNVN